MDVILLEGVENLGNLGDVVTVKPGYARNYLLPQKKALRATEENKKQFEAQRKALEEENEKRLDEAAAAAKKLEGQTIAVLRQAGEAGQLYGSVNNRDIADTVSEKTGEKIDRLQVRLDTPIKAIGLHPVRITLYADVTADITVNVARSEDEAKVQEETGKAVIREEEQPVEEVAEVEVDESVVKPVEETGEDVVAGEEEAGSEPETAQESEKTAGDNEEESSDGGEEEEKKD